MPSNVPTPRTSIGGAFAEDGGGVGETSAVRKGTGLARLLIRTRDPSSALSPRIDGPNGAGSTSPSFVRKTPSVLSTGGGSLTASSDRASGRGMSRHGSVFSLFSGKSVLSGAHSSGGVSVLNKTADDNEVIIRSYVPTAVVKRHTETGDIPLTVPSREVVEVCGFIVDIHGFTSLCEKFTVDDDGADKLSAILNRFFGSMISIIQNFRGDIYKFAGDALLVVWPMHETDEGKTDRVARVILCALTIQKRLHNWSAGHGIKLSIRIGVGTGKIVNFHVGIVEQRMEFVSTGEAITDMKIAEGLAPPGHVVASPDTFRCVKHILRSNREVSVHPLAREDYVDISALLEASIQSSLSAENIAAAALGGPHSRPSQPPTPSHASGRVSMSGPPPSMAALQRQQTEQALIEAERKRKESKTSMTSTGSASAAAAALDNLAVLKEEDNIASPAVIRGFSKRTVSVSSANGPQGLGTSIGSSQHVSLASPSTASASVATAATDVSFKSVPSTPLLRDDAIPLPNSVVDISGKDGDNTSIGSGSQQYWEIVRTRMITEGPRQRAPSQPSSHPGGRHAPSRQISRGSAAMSDELVIDEGPSGSQLALSSAGAGHVLGNPHHAMLRRTGSSGSQILNRTGSNASLSNSTSFEGAAPGGAGGRRLPRKLSLFKLGNGISSSADVSSASAEFGWESNGSMEDVMTAPVSAAAVEHSAPKAPAQRITTKSLRSISHRLSLVGGRPPPLKISPSSHSLYESAISLDTPGIVEKDIVSNVKDWDKIDPTGLLLRVFAADEDDDKDDAVEKASGRKMRSRAQSFIQSAKKAFTPRRSSVVPAPPRSSVIIEQRRSSANHGSQRASLHSTVGSHHNDTSSLAESASPTDTAANSPTASHVSLAMAGEGHEPPKGLVEFQRPRLTRGNSRAGSGLILNLPPPSAKKDGKWSITDALQKRMDKRRHSKASSNSSRSGHAVRVSANALLLAYLPDSLVKFIKEGSGQEWLSEVRPVTILFINVNEDCAQDNAELESLIQDAFECVQAQAERFDGSLNKVFMFDKGLCFVVGFGMAHHNHEDAASRGMRAAMAIRDALASRGIGTSIGVTSGRVFSGVYGSAARREYTVIGDAVNLSARLMEAAKVTEARILCDVKVKQKLKGVRVEALTPIFVKGKSEALEVFQPVLSTTTTTVGTHHERSMSVAGHTQTASERRGSVPGVSIASGGSGRSNGNTSEAAPLVGRTMEIASFDQFLNYMQTDIMGHVIILRAETGMGKSRMATHYRWRAVSRGVSVVFAVADQNEQSTPLFMVRQLIQGMLMMADLQSHDGDGPAAAPHQDMTNDAMCSRIRNWLSLEPEMFEYLSLLNGLVAAEFPETDAAKKIKGQARADKVRRLLLTMLLSGLSASPTVLVVEDAHWIDSMSLGLLASFIAAQPPVVVVITSRQMKSADQMQQDWVTIDNHPCTVSYDLQPFTESQTRELICLVLSVDHVPDAFVRLVHSRAQGNPLFTEELVFSARDQGVLDFGGPNGRDLVIAEGTDISTVRFPESVQDVIVSRINNLPPSDLLMLKAAAVIGRVFTLRMLLDVYPDVSDPRDIVQRLHELERLDIIYRDSSAAGDAPGNASNSANMLSSRSSVFLTSAQDAAMVPLSELNAAYVFRHVLTLETVYNSLLHSQKTTLHRRVATHIEQATTPGDMENVAPMLAHHWLRAGEPTRAFSYFVQSGEYAVRTHAYQEAFHFLTQARNLLLAEHAIQRDQVQCANATFLLGVTCLELHYYTKAVAFLQDCLSQLGHRQPTRGFGMAVVALRHWFSTAVDSWGVFGGKNKVLSADDDRRCREMATMLYSLLLIYMHQHRNNPRLEYAMVSMMMLDITRPIEKLSERAVAYSNAAVAASAFGRRRQFDNYRHRVVTHPSAQDPSIHVALAHFNCGNASMRFSQWKYAVEHFDTSMAMYGDLCESPMAQEANFNLACVRLFTGRHYVATQMIEGLIQLAREGEDLFVLPAYYCMLFTAQLQEQTVPSAYDGLIGPMCDICDELSVLQAVEEQSDAGTMHLFHMHAILAVFYARAGDFASAAETLANALPGVDAIRADNFTRFFGLFAVVEVLVMFMTRAGRTALANGGLSPLFASHSELLAATRKALVTLDAFSRVYTFARPRARHMRGLYHYLRGKTGKGERSIRKAVALARKLEMEQEAAWAESHLKWIVVGPPATGQPPVGFMVLGT